MSNSVVADAIAATTHESVRVTLCSTMQPYGETVDADSHMLEAFVTGD